jgi:putative ABC transport system permease protein
MGLVRLSVRNAGRAPVRGGLTVLAVAVTLVAYVLLRTLSAGWTARIEQTPNDRVVVRNKVGWANTLPMHVSEEVRRMPGVKRAFGANYVNFKIPADEGVFFQSAAVEAKECVEMHDELSAPAGEKEAFIANRHGAMVGAELAAERGWKVGDQLHFSGRDFPGEWDLEVESIVKSTRAGFGQRTVWMHYDYFNERLSPPDKDRLMLVVAQVDDPSAIGNLVRAIDIHFDTATDQTFSQDDKALNTALVGEFGAMLEAMNMVSLLVLGVVVLILGNTIGMSTRERTREYGTLRALGFTPRHLAGLVLGEAAALGVAGGLLGLLIAYPLVQGPFSRYLEEEMAVSPLRVASGDALGAVVSGMLLAVVAAGLPARRAAKLQVTDSLSHVA